MGVSTGAESPHPVLGTAPTVLMVPSGRDSDNEPSALGYLGRCCPTGGDVRATNAPAGELGDVGRHAPEFGGVAHLAACRRLRPAQSLGDAIGVGLGHEETARPIVEMGGTGARAGLGHEETARPIVEMGGTGARAGLGTDQPARLPGELGCRPAGARRATRSPLGLRVSEVTAPSMPTRAIGVPLGARRTLRPTGAPLSVPESAEK